MIGMQDYWRQLSANSLIVACRTANPTSFLRPVLGSASLLSATAIFWRLTIDAFIRHDRLLLLSGASSAIENLRVTVCIGDYIRERRQTGVGTNVGPHTMHAPRFSCSKREKER